MLARGSRRLRRQGLTPRRNLDLAPSNFFSRPWPAVGLRWHRRTKPPVEQIQRSNLPRFLSPLLTAQNPQPAEITHGLFQDVRNRQPCRHPSRTTSLLLLVRPWPDSPVAPFRRRHPDRTQHR